LELNGLFWDCKKPHEEIVKSAIVAVFFIMLVGKNMLSVLCILMVR
jgi:hypothetical protein